MSALAASCFSGGSGQTGITIAGGVKHHLCFVPFGGASPQERGLYLTAPGAEVLSLVLHVGVVWVVLC